MKINKFDIYKKIKEGKLRDNLVTPELRNLSLYIASSCDLMYLKIRLDNDKIFKSIRYNFHDKTSEDAFVEIMNSDSLIFKSDICIVSITESLKQYIHSILKDNDNDSKYDMLEKMVMDRVDKVVKTINNCKKIKECFFFTYAIDEYADFYSSIYNKHNLQVLFAKLKLKLIEVVQTYPKFNTFFFQEAIHEIGYNKRVYRKEYLGSHPEPNAALYLVSTFLEKLQFKINNKKIKCIAVDLDNTLLKGTIREDGLDKCKVNYPRLTVINRHSSNGIPICVCSKNDPKDLIAIKNKFKSVSEEFYNNVVLWMINWNPKSENIKYIQKKLSIGIDTIAMFDDSHFEREEIKFNAKGVKVYTDEEIYHSVRYHEFNFYKISNDARERVKKYKDNLKRDDHEKDNVDSFKNIDEYLMSLNFIITFDSNKKIDLTRVFELVQRTNQQNITMKRRTTDEIISYIKKNNILTIQLKDKFGDYGMIGTIMYAIDENKAIIDELAISCRALGKKVEECIITYLINNLKTEKVDTIIIDVVQTEKNRSFVDIFINYGFVKESNRIIYKIDKSKEYPKWFTIK